MKNSILIIGVMMTFMVLISCSTRRKVGNHQIFIENQKDQTIVIPDSTLEPGYNPNQRAFAYYLMSLPKEEQEKWKLNFFQSSMGIQILSDDIQKHSDTKTYRRKVIFSKMTVHKLKGD